MSGAPEPATRPSPDDSSGSLAKNAASQIGGRLLLSLGRLGAALMIARMLGSERFGEYGLVLTFVVLFEWLCDFGQTDIAVRDICQRPQRDGEVLGALAWLKVAQGALGCLLLPCLLAAMAYPAAIVRAGAVGGVSLLCYAGLQIQRTRFKVRMCTERDVAAELGGLLVMLPLTWLACRAEAGVDVLVGCYTAARVAFLALMVAFARGAVGPQWRRAGRRQATALFWQAAPLGVVGLLVSVYDSMPAILLSKLSDMHAVAAYSAATRFVYPVIIIVQSLSSAFFPPLSAHWRTAPARFAALQQTALDLSLFVGGGLFCGICGGAGFLMGIMGPAIGEAAPVLQWMTLVVLARAVTTAMSPLIVIARRQAAALWLTGASVALQAATLLLVIPRYGLVGAVLGYLALELVLGVVPVSLLGQHVAGVRMRWGVPARLLASALAATAAAAALPTSSTLAGGVVAGVLYLLLALATGGLSPGKLRTVLADIAAARRTARAPGATA